MKNKDSEAITLESKLKNLLLSSFTPDELEAFKEKDLITLIKSVEKDVFKERYQEEINLHRIRVLKEARNDIYKYHTDIHEIVDLLENDLIKLSKIEHVDKARLQDKELLQSFVELIVNADPRCVEYFLTKVLLASYCLRNAADYLHYEISQEEGKILHKEGL